MMLAEAWAGPGVSLGGDFSSFAFGLLVDMPHFICFLGHFGAHFGAAGLVE